MIVVVPEMLHTVAITSALANDENEKRCGVTNGMGRARTATGRPAPPNRFPGRGKGNPMIKNTVFCRTNYAARFGERYCMFCPSPKNYVIGQFEFP